METGIPSRRPVSGEDEHPMRLRNREAVVVLLLLAVCVFAPLVRAETVPSATARDLEWVQLGPEGGDVRSLTYDPRNPERIYLGTSAGQLYVSTNNGVSWSRFAHLGGGSNYVLDNMEINPQTGIMYVAAWDGHIEHENGDLFRSTDAGKTWQALPDMRGKSIRAMVLAPSDPRIVLAGALDGVFRSRDGGDTFERISPPNHTEIKNIESLAVDPKDPNIIYAGTWHLAWKTADGGRTWHSIKKGVVDDSDVFSIIVDSSNTQNVYLSACSGIYKSENQAELFHKIQGIPFSARRTRVLKQDPGNPAVVYAGTTEGLWKTSDAGKTWRRITPPNIIVNDVHVDPRNAARVLIATDRSGVLASNDAGQTFTASNRGFAHRYVSAVVVDRNDPQTIYAGVMNDKEFGGVFVSRNGGATWTQLSSGLGDRDVFALQQADDGAIVAGTNQGVFLLDRATTQWRPINSILREKLIPAKVTVKPANKARGKSLHRAPPASRTEWTRSELTGQVNALELTPKKWFLASPAGLFESVDQGRSWKGEAVRVHQAFVAITAADELVVAMTHTAALISEDNGTTWKIAQLPSYVTAVYGGAIETRQADQNSTLPTGPSHVLWLATREGALRSEDRGVTWEHVLAGLPARHLARIQYDAESARLVAISFDGNLFVSEDRGQNWRRQATGFPVRNVTLSGGRMVAATAFDGVIAPLQPSVQRATMAGAVSH
jgi:photosystem II stability/assembly factor-like uncharacterized protein